MQLAIFIKALAALDVTVRGSNEDKHPEWMEGAVHGLADKNMDLVWDQDNGRWLITANRDPWMEANVPLTLDAIAFPTDAGIGQQVVERWAGHMFRTKGDDSHEMMAADYRKLMTQRGYTTRTIDMTHEAVLERGKHVATASLATGDVTWLGQG